MASVADEPGGTAADREDPQPAPPAPAPVTDVPAPPAPAAVVRTLHAPPAGVPRPGTPPYGQGGGPAQPYGGPWRQTAAPPPQQQKQQMSGQAVASFALGMFGFAVVTWAAGLALGIVALLRLRGRPEVRGRGLAVTGIVLSCGWAVVLALTVPSLIGRAADAGTVPVVEVGPGGCFEEGPDSGGRLPRRVTPAPCDGPHRGELFAVVPLAGGPYPGADAAGRATATGCTARHGQLDLDPRSLPAAVRVLPYPPTRADWAAVPGWGLCFYVSDEPRTGGLRRDRTAYTEDQLTWLTATRPLFAALSAEPAGSAAEKPEEYRRWAHDVSDGAARARAGLGVFPADRAGGLIAEFRTRLDALQRHAAAAAVAADPALLTTAVATLRTDLGALSDAPSRTALGLPPAVPLQARS
ncbi:hypothetical protein KNE206_39870 [Kitasatospora sp. NE20-6]|uniref:DUF4190 domain-containing protein n=1 Tax=Kitasatospora sp. NE20-6 TaxID=2859066 RepID=UPI0034DC0A09